MKRLVVLVFLALMALSVLPLGEASAAPAVAGSCNRESQVETFPGRMVLYVIEGGQPVPNVRVLAREATTGREIGQMETDAGGRLGGRLGPGLRSTGVEVELTIFLPSGRTEQCRASIPPGGEPAPPPPAPPDTLDRVLGTLFGSTYGQGFQDMYDLVGIPISVQVMPEEVFGAYNGRRIAINARYASNLEGLATVLSHELTHAWQDYEGRIVHPPRADPEACFAAEFEATVNDMAVWLSFFPQLRLPPRDVLDEDLNHTARTLLRSGPEAIDNLVRLNYQRQCVGDTYRWIRSTDRLIGWGIWRSED